MTAFEGFPTGAFTFLDGLAADNTTEWFDRHRASYKADVAGPSAAFVDAVVPLLQATIHPGLRGEAKVGRSLFRINRDTRFSADKTPYRTHLDFLFWVGAGAPRECPACILRITSTTVLLGAGQMGLAGAALDAYRARVADRTTGAAVRRAVDRLTDAGAEMSEPSRARVPAPYPADHLNADLLRRDGFHVSHTVPHPPSIRSAGFAEWCAGEWQRYRPLLEWYAPVG